MSLKPSSIDNKDRLAGHSVSVSAPSESLRVTAEPQSMSKRQGDSLHQHLTFLAPILIVYLSLGLFNIGGQSLWVDEVLSLRYIDADQLDSALWRGPRPLYFALLHLWAQLGTSESVLRTLSVLIGGISVLLTFRIGLKFFGERVARIGTILIATSPFLIWYSQEVRYITLLIAASAFSMYAFHLALREERLRWWVLYGCSLLLAIGTFVTNVLLIAAHALYVILAKSRRDVLRRALVCQVLALVVFAWWANGWEYGRVGGYWRKFAYEITTSREDLTSVPRGDRLKSGGERNFELGTIPYTFFALSTGFSIGPSVRELQSRRSARALKPYTFLLASLGILFGGLFLLGLFAMWQEADRGLFFTLWFVVPVIGVCMVSAMTAMAYNVRYVAMVLPAYAIILAVGMGRLSNGWAQIVVLSAVLLVNGISLGNYYFNPRYAREDARAAAEHLESVARPDDRILVVGNATALRHYYIGKVAIEGWSGVDQDGQVSTEDGVVQPNGICGRVWLVEIRPWERDAKGMAKATLGEVHELIGSEKFPGVDIYAYRKKSPLACAPFAS